MEANKLNGKNLMVGDWVVYEGDTNYDNPIRIEGMDIATKSLITSDREDVGFDGIEPIPLTAEILEQNGFEEKTESNPFVYYLFKDGDNSVSLEHTYDTTDKEDYWACSIGNRLCDVCTISMHYIHELQHALRLCWIDKEIVL